LAEEVGEGKELAEDKLTTLAELTIEMVTYIQRQLKLVDFWSNFQAQKELHSWIVTFLDDREVLPFPRLDSVADRIVELAKALHVRLTT
jgi:hypothetical protein